MKTRLLAASCCLLMILCGACSQPAEEFYLDVTDAAAAPLRSLSFGWTGASATVRIQSNGTWSLNAPGWVTPSRKSGIGVADIVLSAAANPGDASREGELVVRQGDDSVSITLTQDARPAEPAVQPTLSVSDGTGSALRELSAGPEGVRTLIRVASNTDWTLTPGDPWLDASTSGASGDAEVQLNVRANAVSQERRGAFVFAAGDLVVRLEVIQAGETEITPATPPKADLLDVEFQSDGTARDVSTAALKVVAVPSSTLTVQYNPTYRRYMAVFDNVPGETVKSGFYYADYENNAAVKKGLEDSHSLELLMCCEQLPATGTSTVKPFSLMESGGTGFLYASSAQLVAQRRFSFLPYIGGGYQYVVADGVGVGKWHHVVGVWDSAEGRSHIYVDGHLSGTTVTPGAYSHAAATALHFVIGGDAGKGFASAQASFRGEIAVARAYSMALTPGEVLGLYQSLMP